MTLHLISHSSQISQAIQVAKDKDALLLLQEAVYAGAPPLPELSTFADSSRLYYLSDDAKARGIEVKIGQPIDYAGFVQLTLDFQRTLSW